MKKVLILIIMILFISGCTEEESKNIYHSKWLSTDGYKLLIVDPSENSSISKESCSVYMGDSTLGKCIVVFDKENETLRISWSYCKGSCSNLDNLNVDGVTISKDTKEFILNNIKFKYDSNLKSDI